MKTKSKKLIVLCLCLIMALTSVTAASAKSLSVPSSIGYTITQFFGEIFNGMFKRNVIEYVKISDVYISRDKSIKVYADDAKVSDVYFYNSLPGSTVKTNDSVSTQPGHEYYCVVVLTDGHVSGAKKVTIHSCSYKNQTVVLEATCTQDGQAKGVCSCGATKMIDIPAKGHNFSDYVSDDNATYTEDGTMTATCSTCGYKQTVTDKGSALFKCSVNYNETGEAESITIVKYTASNGRYSTCEIPDTINGLPVVCIGESAFAGRTDLRIIKIPTGITRIEKYAFKNCSNASFHENVTEVYPERYFYIYNLELCVLSENSYGLLSSFGENLTYLGEEAFYGCHNLKGVLLPSTLTYIGSNCFGDTYLTTYIDDNACTCDIFFEGTESQAVSLVSDNNSDLRKNAIWHCTYKDFYYSYKNNNEVNLECYLGNETSVSVPGTIYNKNVSELIATFSHSNIESVSIPSSVNIGNYAFNYCDQLKTINIPYYCTSIGFQAFAGCTSLTSVNIPDKVTSIGRNAFYQCENLKSVYGARNITSIGNCAFAKCTSLTSFIIPASVSNIDTHVFGDCDSLTDVIVPYSVLKKMNYTSFYYCPLNINIYVSAADDVDLSKFSNYFQYCSVSVCRIPYNVSASHYLGKVDITEYLGSDSALTIPAAIGSFPVYSVTGIGKDITELTVSDGILLIQDDAFKECPGMTKITLPESLEEIYSGAFETCTQLTDVYYNGTDNEKGNIDISTCRNLPLFAAKWHIGKAHHFDNYIQNEDGTYTSVCSDEGCTVTDTTPSSNPYEYAVSGYCYTSADNYYWYDTCTVDSETGTAEVSTSRIKNTLTTVNSSATHVFNSSRNIGYSCENIYHEFEINGVTFLCPCQNVSTFTKNSETYYCCGCDENTVYEIDASEVLGSQHVGYVNITQISVDTSGVDTYAWSFPFVIGTTITGDDVGQDDLADINFSDSVVTDATQGDGLSSITLKNFFISGTYTVYDY